MHEQIIIVGGGPVGLVTAITLARAGFDITILNASLSTKTDERVLALSYASFMQIHELGIEFKKIATPINKVHVSHNGLGVSNIDCADVHLEHLGFTVKYSELVALLNTKTQEYTNIKLMNVLVTNVIPGNNYATVVFKQNESEEIITAGLVILAEGGGVQLKNIQYKIHDYEQIAVVTKVTTQASHKNIAYERFEVDGAMVLLPHENDYVLVWSLKSELAKACLDKEFLLRKLQSLGFMKRFGNISLKHNVASFPLKLQVARERVQERVVLIGNSSQIVHPVSAQGLNLGLRDVRDLCEILINSGNKELNIINNYNELRNKDVRYVSNFTHILAKFLERQNPLINHCRGLGLVALSNCKFLQNKLTESLIFGM